MSGTSADGVSVAIVDLAGQTFLSATVRAHGNVPYSADVRKQVLHVAEPGRGRVDELCRLNFALGEIFARALIRIAKRAKVPLHSIDLIGSHGQTVCHLPPKKAHSTSFPGSTLQIGEPAIIAERTGITTVADFRPRDMAAGGEGAPLVPFADYRLFRHRTKSRALQNIGGIANVTYLAAGGTLKDVIAFDTGPGNMVMDALTQIITNGRLAYDAGGRLAAKGEVNEAILRRLMRHPFLKARPPKSTGREEFGRAFAEPLYRDARRRKIASFDLLATATAFTACSIADAYRRFLPGPVDEVILCGGGAHNATLVAMIRVAIPEAAVGIIDDYGIPTDAKEAVSFAILARETWLGRPSNVPSATGARSPVILGKIVPGRRRQ